MQSMQNANRRHRELGLTILDGTIGCTREAMECATESKSLSMTRKSACLFLKSRC